MAGTDFLAWLFLAWIVDDRPWLLALGAIAIGVPIALAAQWTYQCSAWINDGSARCQRPRAGIFKRYSPPLLAHLMRADTVRRMATMNETHVAQRSRALRDLLDAEHRTVALLGVEHAMGAAEHRHHALVVVVAAAA